jgi:predicted GNAT superfamily acetyltransferase
MPGMSDDTALVAIPADIDALLAARPDQALTWRLRIRETLCQAFAAGFVIAGFHPALGDSDPAYLLERRPASND